jgi:DNA repair exonuclease SbcCD nuclease subunit
MKILFVSDTHFDNHADFATPDASAEYPGVNSRMLRILEAFVRAADYAVTNGIERIFVPGDVFHRRGIINVAVFNAVSKLFGGLREVGITIYLMAGNHDVVDRHGTQSYDGLHALYAMGSAVVFNEPSFTKLGMNLPFCVIPYTSSREQWMVEAKRLLLSGTGSSRPPILIVHQSFSGAYTGPHEYVMREGLDPRRDVPEGYAAVVSGHYHMHQVLEGVPAPVIYVGGLVQHNFGERTYPPGWLVYDGERETFEHVIDQFSPRFEVVKTDNPNVLHETKASSNYLRVEWTGEPAAFHRLVAEAEGKVSSSVSFKLAEVPTTQPARLSLSGTESAAEIIERYVAYRESNHLPLPDVDRAELLDAGRRFLIQGTRSGAV